MQLIPPTIQYKQSWLEALQEFHKEQIDGFWNIPDKPKNLDEYIQRTIDYSKGKNLPEWFVPNTTYWLIDHDTFIGHINIRHTINDTLKKEGGHIGYAIRPTEQQKGYGYTILTLALPKAKEIGIQKALITCYENNIASAKIIEKNGGIYQDTITFKDNKVKRYWIDLI